MLLPALLACVTTRSAGSDQQRRTRPRIREINADDIEIDDLETEQIREEQANRDAENDDVPNQGQQLVVANNAAADNDRVSC